MFLIITRQEIMGGYMSLKKALIISLQPEDCELVARGKKTIVIKKTMPKIETPFKCYIYCTKGDTVLYRIKGGSFFAENYQVPMRPTYNGKVIGEFICNEIIKYSVSDYHSIDLESACLTSRDFASYIGFKDNLYSWYISDLKIYDHPKELGEFKTTCYNCANSVIGNSVACKTCSQFEPITRPPQSWCYTEEL